MQIDLVRHGDAETYPDCDVSTVTLVYSIDGRRCSFCGNRAVVWSVSPVEATAHDPRRTPLGAPDSCADCMNELLLTGALRVMSVDPNSF